MSTLKKIDEFIRAANHRRIDGMRAFKLRLALLVFPVLGKLLQKRTFNSELNILVFRLDDKIGDSITATGFLYQLKENFPQHRLVVLAGKNSAFIYKQLEFIDEVFVVKKSVISTLQIYFKIFKRKYKFIFNTSHLLNPQVIFLNCFLQASRKLTFLNNKVNCFTDHIQYNPLTDHITQRYQNVLEAVGVQKVKLDYQISFAQTSEAKKAIEVTQKLRQKYSRIVILNSFAGARLRNLNQQTTTQIVESLLVKNANALIISVGSADDLPQAQKWIAELDHPNWICFPEETNLAFNFELLRQADLVITPDTSFVHAASAFKKSLVAVYRQDEAQEKNSLIWAPYLTRAEVVYAPHDPLRKEDINTVDPEFVVQKALKLIE